MQVRDKVKIYTIDGKKCKEIPNAIFDTGSKSTYISDKVGNELTYHKLSEPYEILLATKDTTAKVIGGESYNIEISGCKIPSTINAEIIENLRDDIIIGTDVMEKFDIELDLKEGKPKLKKCPPELSLV